MSEQVLRNGNVMARSKTRTITQVAMLGAIAGILMNLEFPIPFLAPTFYQLDFSEIPVLIGSFAMGPVAGVLIELVKILVHLVSKGSMTAGVGDVANFIFGCTFAVPAGLIYRYKSIKSRKHESRKVITFRVFSCEDYLFQKEKMLFRIKTADRKRRVTL